MKCICNFGYARGKRGNGAFPDVKGLLKYLQYRNSRDDHIPGAGGPNRWVDGGLGTNYQSILARLDQLSPANPHAYCFAVVVSPDPEAMAELMKDAAYDEDLHEALFAQAVRGSLDDWEAWREEHDARRQAGVLEYSYVIHRPQRSYGEQMHAHVILAAATENALTRERTPLYNNQPEIIAFKEIVYRELDRVYEIGLEKEPEKPLELEPKPDRWPAFSLEREILFHEWRPPAHPAYPDEAEE